MNLTSQFETVTVSRSQKDATLEQLMQMMSRSEIRIVDIKRHHDELVIIYRKLN